MSLKSRFATNPDLETGTGVVLDYSPDGKITIHRAGGKNTKYLRLAAAKQKRVERSIRTGNINPDALTLALAEIYADSVIIGWEDVLDDDGKPLAFTRANVIDLLTAAPDLFDDIRAQAEEAATFRDEDTKDAAKNLSSGSTSTSRKAKKPT